MILVDTSGVLAAIDPRQAGHQAAQGVLVRSQPRIMSPYVLAELDYLILTNAGINEETKLLSDVARGAYELAQVGASDVAAALTIIERYADLNLGLTDASIVVLAERFHCHDVLTLDQRHFRAVLGLDGAPFRLLPADEVGLR